MDLVRNDTAPNGKVNGFEATDYYVLPHDPVVKKQVSGTKISMDDISITSGPDASYFSSEKSASVKTRVDFFYERDEYNHLTNYQKEELCGYRKNQSINKVYQSNERY